MAIPVSSRRDRWPLLGLVFWSLLALGPGLPAAETERPTSPPVEKESPAEAGISLEQVKFFEEQIRPLLVTHCYKCHGEDKQSGDLRVDSRAGLLLGGESGAAIVPGQTAESLLLEAVKYESYEMPPEGKLSDDKIALIEKWVEMGAPWPGEMGQAPVRKAGEKLTDEDRAYWFFQPLHHSSPPELADDRWSRTEIDHFLMARLHEAGIAPQPEADRLTLIRRATQMVTGLPPTSAEVAQFLEDKSPFAYENLVERLLDSPRRGEHLAKFWLDLVRYAESDGYRLDSYRPTAWRYRDYVVRAFNSDKPYDLFLTEQLAGDEHAPDNPDSLAATGFLRLGVYEYNQRDAEGQWKVMLEDVTDTTADAFLALGMGCAKCHDHKFDPILQADYYRLQAFFSNISPQNETVLATPAEKAAFAAQLAEWEEATQSIRAELASIEQPVLKRLEEGAVKLFVPEIQVMWNKPFEQRTGYERQISWLVERQVQEAQKKLDAQIKGADKQRRDALNEQLKGFDHLKPAPLPLGETVVEFARNVSPVFIPGKNRLGEMTPGYLTVLGVPVPEILPPEQAPESTGRRLALARWLTQPDHPLTSRVIVNRIWQQHFGTGLVSTVSDFGRLGEPPSHPELLDWMASEFVNHGWSIKWLQRQILLSAAFRQSSLSPVSTSRSVGEVDPEVVDSSNRLLWRYPVRRLAAEQIRDAVLAVSGELSLKEGGAGEDAKSTRRSVFLQVRRNDRNDVLNAFDLPDRITSSGDRNTTTSPMQSLLMVNSDWAVERAASFARRVAKEAGANDDARIRTAYQLAFGRQPSEQELLRDADFLRQRRDLTNRTGGALATRAMLLTGSSAAAISESPDERPLLVTDSKALPQTDFTFEGVVLLKSIYPNANVRTIASRWDSDTQHPGWSLGVTSEQSRYKPRNVILQLVGTNPDGKVTYEVIPSNIHLELDRPYYVACAVRLGETGPKGVTFFVRDLVDPQGDLQVAAAAHQVTGGVQNDLPILIGGRQGGGRHSWDGLIDDVRLSSISLGREQLLESSRRMGGTSQEVAAADQIGFWTFTTADAQGQDESGHGRHLHLVGSVEVANDPPLLDFCHVLMNSNEFLYLD